MSARPKPGIAAVGRSFAWGKEIHRHFAIMPDNAGYVKSTSLPLRKGTTTRRSTEKSRRGSASWSCTVRLVNLLSFPYPPLCFATQYPSARLLELYPILDSYNEIARRHEANQDLCPLHLESSFNMLSSSASSTPSKSATAPGTPSPNITPLHDPAHQAKVMKQHKPLGVANRECGSRFRGDRERKVRGSTRRMTRTSKAAGLLELRQRG
jgi:hypothetical protein